MKTFNCQLTPAKLALAVAAVLACSGTQASTSFDEATQTHTWKDADNGHAVHFRGNANDATPKLENGQNIKFLNTSSRWILGDYQSEFSYSLDKISFTNTHTEGAHKFFAVIDGTDNNNGIALDPEKTYLTINELRLGLNTALQMSGNITDKTADIRKVVVTRDVAEGHTVDEYDPLKNAVNIHPNSRRHLCTTVLR